MQLLHAEVIASWISIMCSSDRNLNLLLTFQPISDISVS